MSARVEAAKLVALERYASRPDSAYIKTLLTASDSVLFSEAAIERAAKAAHDMGVKDMLWTERDEVIRELYREDVRVIIAALREEA